MTCYLLSLRQAQNRQENAWMAPALQELSV